MLVYLVLSPPPLPTAQLNVWARLHEHKCCLVSYILNAYILHCGICAWSTLLSMYYMDGHNRYKTILIVIKRGGGGGTSWTDQLLKRWYCIFPSSSFLCYVLPIASSLRLPLLSSQPGHSYSNMGAETGLFFSHIDHSISQVYSRRRWSEWTYDFKECQTFTYDRSTQAGTWALRRHNLTKSLHLPGAHRLVVRRLPRERRTHGQPLTPLPSPQSSRAIPALAGRVIPVTEKVILGWQPCQVPCAAGSMLGLLGPMSIYCDWERKEKLDLHILSLAQVQLSTKICPWGTRCMLLGR